MFDEIKRLYEKDCMLYEKEQQQKKKMFFTVISRHQKPEAFSEL